MTGLQIDAITAVRVGEADQKYLKANREAPVGQLVITFKVRLAKC